MFLCVAQFLQTARVKNFWMHTREFENCSGCYSIPPLFTVGLQHIFTHKVGLVPWMSQIPIGWLMKKEGFPKKPLCYNRLTYDDRLDDHQPRPLYFYQKDIKLVGAPVRKWLRGDEL